MKVASPCILLNIALASLKFGISSRSGGYYELFDIYRMFVMRYLPQIDILWSKNNE